MTIRIGIAGYGRRAQRHADAVNQLPGAHVAAISDPSESARRTARAQLPGAAIHESVSAMSDSGGVDAVIVAAPAHLNGTVAAEPVVAGLPVLIEKPPALTVRKLDELRGAAIRSGAKVMVAFNRRFNPLVRAAVEVIEAAGPLHQIVAEFHKDIHEFTDSERVSPSIYDLMLLESPIHSVDLVTYFANSAVRDVAARVKRASSGYRDVHAALIEFENDIVCQFTAAYTAGGRLERYELHGEYVSVYLEGVNRGWVLRGGDQTELEVGPEAENDTVAQARAFVDAVANDSEFAPPAATLDTSMATLRLCENILAGTD